MKCFRLTACDTTLNLAVFLVVILTFNQPFEYWTCFFDNKCMSWKTPHFLRGISDQKNKITLFFGVKQYQSWWRCCWLSFSIKWRWHLEWSFLVRRRTWRWNARRRSSLRRWCWWWTRCLTCWRIDLLVTDFLLIQLFITIFLSFWSVQKALKVK